MYWIISPFRNISQSWILTFQTYTYLSSQVQSSSNPENHNSNLKSPLLKDPVKSFTLPLKRSKDPL
jgi:hypothetical protein